MTHWNKGDVSAEHLLKQFPWLKDYVTNIQFQDFGWLGACAFVVTISPKAGSGKTGTMTINLAEQPGCCGYSNFLYPTFGAPFDAKTWLDVAMHCADLVYTSGIQYVGTAGMCKTPVMKEMAANGWKTVHEMPNRRYGQTGTKLTVLCINRNTFKEGKPLHQRIKKGIYG